MTTTARPRHEVEAEIKETLGLVPSFFSAIPDRLLDHEWAIFSDLELDETLIPNKYKELMGVALHTPDLLETLDRLRDTASVALEQAVRPQRAAAWRTGPRRAGARGPDGEAS